MAEQFTKPTDAFIGSAQRPLDVLGQQRADTLKKHLEGNIDMIMQYWKLMQVELGAETPGSVNDLAPDSPIKQVRTMVTEYQRERSSVRKYMAQLAEYIGNDAAEVHLSNLIQKYNVTYVTMGDLLGPGAEPKSGNG
ncbi:hypothetical protein KBC79_04350 [Candidatus Woesebacteria bacterium]|nr:hypothetical protein [Candidatus Woesebacteria bacterium]